MLRSLARASLLVCVGLAVATACGSDDSKKTRRGDYEGAGAGGEPTKPSGGGSKNFAGQPAAPEGGGGAGSEPLPMGGQAGQPPVVTPAGGMGGQPGSEPLAGAAGMTLASAGAGGTPPDACCQPKTCDEVFPPADLKWGFVDNGCGNAEVFCGCPVGTQSQDDGTCVACQVDAEFCMSHCGDTFDNCGNPISCADNCSNFEETCFEGSCCSPLTFCEGGCGEQSDGCGGFVDCGNNCDGSDCVDGSCCFRDNEACLGHDCGQAWDNCEYVDCGTACEGTTACIDQTCQDSVCKANGFNCGQVDNPLPEGGIEDCGVCPDYQACVDNVCIPICGITPG